MATQEDHEAFERLVGGPDRGFRLMRMWQEAGYTVSSDRYQLHPPNRTREGVFRQRAKEDRYTQEQIAAFIKLQ